jgi:ubiquinone/menaquinone biosynthesis C-methylase UbiE
MEARAYDAISSHYDLMMQDRTPFIAHYAALLEPGQRSLLDIACGTGTITVALASHLQALAGAAPIRVVGMDGSAGMLKVAQQRAPEIEWVEGDMRALPPECGPVDLAVCCYNSLQHLDPTGFGEALRSIRGVLSARGRFAFDIYRPNLPYLRQQRTDTLARELQDADGTRMEIREDSVFDEEAGILTLNWRLVRPDAPDEPPLAQTAYQLWQHHPDTVEAALAAAGFQIIERYGDLDRSPFGPSAKKQVMICVAA